MGTEKIPAVQLEQVSVAYDGRPALEDVSMTIEQGDFVGVIGPNGGGKTTLLRVILGLVRPWRGEVSVMGRPAKKARPLVGYVPQVASFERFFPVNVWDVVLMGRIGKRGLWRWYSRTDEALAAEALRTVGLYDQRWRQLGRLSGGQIQRAMIARALATQPRLLLLDEPTAGVDIQAERNLYELLHELNRNMTIVLVSHDVGAISSHVKSIACLNRRLYHHGSKEALAEVTDSLYGCPIDLIAHGIPHRVLPKHNDESQHDERIAN